MSYFDYGVKDNRRQAIGAALASRPVERSAEDVHAMSLANLYSEYCEVTITDQLLGLSG